MTRLILSLLLALFSTGGAQAAFPEKPLRIVSGYAAGGARDLISRYSAEAVGPVLGQRVVVEKRTGLALPLTNSKKRITTMPGVLHTYVTIVATVDIRLQTRVPDSIRPDIRPGLCPGRVHTKSGLPHQVRKIPPCPRHPRTAQRVSRWAGSIVFKGKVRGAR